MHQLSAFRRQLLACLMLGSLLLTGCAFTPKEIETQVQTFSKMPSTAVPTTYWWEQLPSQAQQPFFAPIEQTAEQALARVGLTRSATPQTAHLIAQLNATAHQGRVQHPAYEGYYGPRFGFGMGFGGWGGGWGGLGWLDTPPVIYYRAIKLVLRDPQTQQILYETTAHYDDIRPYDAIIWGVLLDAALRDFPNPPVGQRQLFIPIPAAQAAGTSGSATPSDTKAR